MSKAIFRFLRGELNGYYISNLYMTCNKTADSIKSFMASFSRLVFNIEGKTGEDEVPMTSDQIEGIGVFAGVFSPRVMQDSLLGSIKFTPSHIVNGVEYSERGLFNMAEENFDFIRTDEEIHAGDINTEASAENRTSVVEVGARVLGYIQEGDQLFNEDGTIDYSKILEEPPVNKAYSEWYGKKYLFLAEAVPIVAKSTLEVYYELIKAMQWVRYNGCSITSLCKFVELMCDDYLFITDIEWTSSYARGIVKYGIDKEFEVEDKLLRTETFKMLINMKFPQYLFEEVEIEVTRNAEGKAIHVEVLG